VSKEVAPIFGGSGSGEAPFKVTSVVTPHARPTTTHSQSVWVPFTIGGLVVLVAIALLIAWLRRRGGRITFGR
jgi:hypothetical protein